MKVLFVSRRFYPEIIGGGQISPLYIAKALSSLGHQVHVLTFGKTRETYSYGKVKIYREPIKELAIMKRLSNMDYMWKQIAKKSCKFVKWRNYSQVRIGVSV